MTGAPGLSGKDGEPGIRGKSTCMFTRQTLSYINLMLKNEAIISFQTCMPFSGSSFLLI